MNNVRLIFNPASDRGRSGQKASDLQAVVDQLGGAEWTGTEHPGHASDLAEEAGRQGVETVVAMGGDGTVHEVVNGLMRLPHTERPKMAVVPIGSGNDFAFSSGLPENAQTAMKQAFTGQASPIDIGKITDGSGRSAYWDNSAGMLLDAAINIQSRKITRIYGFLMYLTAAIRGIIENYDATQFEITIDGQTFTEELLLFTVANGRREGGGFMIAPDAVNDDGQLDFCKVLPISRPMMFRLLPVVMNGDHGRFDFVELGRFQKINFKADRAVPVHLDGELFAPYEANLREASLEILPGEINLIR
jgi:YegS/Rv2252/BmrU family lipid kinase